MRRYSLYLIFALVTFAVGSSVVYIFFEKDSPTPVVTPILPAVLPPIEIETASADRFVCEDGAELAVWNELKKNKVFLEDAERVIAARGIRNCTQIFYDRQSLDLNGDGADEIVLKSNEVFFCGSGGDCRTWIVLKAGDKYQIIFDASVGESRESLEILKQKSHKFQSLKISQNNGRSANTFARFEFNGATYRIKQCLKDINSEYDYDDVREEKLISVKFAECS